MRIHRCLAAAAAVTAVALAGCGSASAMGSGSAPASQAAAGAVQHVTLTGTSTLRFTPMTVHVHPGAVRVTLADMGAYPHNVVIPALHLTSKTVTGDPGAGSVSFTVRFPHPGRYAFHCQYHESAGMTGVFVVG